ncbi:uroporphyrinogen decarboxylase family protein [Candidatus Solincola tengchongensis]|uniref:uroporphyrinogen decarboxylase family protein n=1 Tax=Candidatus Solincola tengchongensis TaxID=2900693 RepID=UPI00257A0D2A|nr:uroporphyrinogen decarboxylase family protein [Candidatus Solincola tengchongensis]
MTGRERMLTALRREEPDRVPVWEMAFNEESIIRLGAFFTDDLPPMKLVQRMSMEEKVKLLNTLFTVIRELELDGITSIALLGTEPVDEEHVRDGWGRILRISEEGEATAVGGPVSDPSDLRAVRPYHPQQTDFLMLMAARGALGEGYAHVLVQPGPFRESWSLLGSMEKLLYYYVKNPGFVRDLARLVTDYILEVVDMAADLGADVIALDGDLAFSQSTLMSPAQYEDFVFPYHREITEQAHRRGMLIVKHSDGNMWPIMEGIVEAGFDGFHPVQPQCMDIGEVKTRYGGRLCILGNIDCTYLLPFGSEEEVEETVRETIRVAAPGGGYVISSSNSIHPGCKPENYLALVRAARKYGTYPISVEG